MDTALAAWISAALSEPASIWTASSPEAPSQVTSTSPSSVAVRRCQAVADTSHTSTPRQNSGDDVREDRATPRRNVKADDVIEEAACIPELMIELADSVTDATEPSTMETSARGPSPNQEARASTVGAAPPLVGTAAASPTPPQRRARPAQVLALPGRAVTERLGAARGASRRAARRARPAGGPCWPRRRPSRGAGPPAAWRPERGISGPAPGRRPAARRPGS
ncbi:unnamed protein product [Prorocentrum cordatum]|uniref:Uncharacterized protein n=1 Tax=Prorocentrum cordatum TaxID=2364126 RepID=A0ABN9QYT0_9DINO|nr:unnamed protein product [Polarella glacialis]